MNNRRFVLIGDINSGIASLRTLLRENCSANTRVESFEGVEIRNEMNKFTILLRNRTYQTTFLIVIPLTLTSPSAEWLSCVISLNNNLAISSFNLFRNAMLVLTHADEVCPSLNSDELTQIVMEKCGRDPSWDYLVSRVGHRYVCVDSTKQELGYRSGILTQIIQLSKPTFNIMVHGNNGVSSAELMEKLHLSNHDNVIELENVRLKFYCYPDLDLFQGYDQPECGAEIRRLIGNRDEHGEGITLNLILISQCEIFSANMKELITNIPLGPDYRMDSKTEQYWWDYTTILFSFKRNPNSSRGGVLKSIAGNTGIKKVVRKAGNRYIWMSDRSSKMELKESILSECSKMRQRRNEGEFIGGPSEEYPNKMHQDKWFYSLLKRLCIFYGVLIMGICLFLFACLFIIFWPVTFPLSFFLLVSVALCSVCVHFLVKRSNYIPHKK